MKQADEGGAMSTPLTREQVVLLVGDLVNGYIDAQKEARQILAHDAALRAELATVTQERDEALTRVCTLIDTLPLVVKARYFFDQQHAAAMETVGTLSDALATARQEVWEEAAIYWDTMAEGPCKDSDDFGWACRVAQWCREQAKMETLP